MGECDMDPMCRQLSPTPPHCIPPLWCSNMWCYVDPTACKVVFSHSVYWPNSYRAYSYATCLSADMFTDVELLKSFVSVFIVT